MSDFHESYTTQSQSCTKDELHKAQLNYIGCFHLCFSKIWKGLKS